MKNFVSVLSADAEELPTTHYLQDSNGKKLQAHMGVSGLSIDAFFEKQIFSEKQYFFLQNVKKFSKKGFTINRLLNIKST